MHRVEHRPGLHRGNPRLVQWHGLGISAAVVHAVAGVVPGTTPGALLVGHAPDGAAHKDVVHSIATLASSLGLNVPGGVRVSDVVVE